MYRVSQILVAVLAVVGGMSFLANGYCYYRLQLSPHEPDYPFVYELTHRFQARYVDFYHYQACPLVEIASVIGIVGAVLIGVGWQLSGRPLFRRTG
jgi:hypothetical protein